jgi:hypothetical protein
MSKHRWRLKKHGKRAYLFPADNFKLKHIEVKKIYECVHCGLLRGSQAYAGFTSRGKSFPLLIFFNRDEILSTVNIPFRCQGGVFIEEVEFKI